MNKILYYENYIISSLICNYSNYLELLQNLSNQHNFNINELKIFKDINFEEISNLEIPIIYDRNIFICNNKQMINIIYNNIKYNIPLYMTINEFKLFTNTQNNIFNKYDLEMYSDEYFTNKSIYYSK